VFLHAGDREVASDAAVLHYHGGYSLKEVADIIGHALRRRRPPVQRTPETRTSGSEVRVGETERPKSRHCAPAYSSIFSGSSTSLKLWFEAIYLMASTRCGIPAKQLEREIGVT
jgi:hypothetical protein